jgi:hypothetical protein
MFDYILICDLKMVLACPESRQHVWVPNTAHSPASSTLISIFYISYHGYITGLLTTVRMILMDTTCQVSLLLVLGSDI